MLKILNLGCGHFPLKNTAQRAYWNLDLLKLPDRLTKGATYIRHDMLKFPYPLPEASFDEVYLSHVIEHIDEGEHPKVISEVRRLLKDTGLAKWIYPEFCTCARNYIQDKEGRRDFWKACIYGRPGKGNLDRHVALLDTPVFVQVLVDWGLTPIKIHGDVREDYNTVVICKKGQPIRTYEDLLRIQINKDAAR